MAETMREASVLPFGDLAAEVREIRSEIDDAVARVFDRGWFVLGAEGEAFEHEFAAWLGAAHAVGCGNGTDAITLSLRALGVGLGDEVITVANTCVPTVAGIRDVGCTVRLVDCDPDTLQMCPAALEKALTPATRAVVPVHLYGSCPDMGRICSLCSKAGVHVIEDCAQAHGAAWEGRPAGRWGVLSAWSFYPSKNLGAYGDGGAVITDDPALAERLRRTRNYGQRVRYYHDDEGRNSRLDEIQAAILRVKLRHLGRWNERRRQIAAIYAAELDRSDVRIPPVAAECLTVRHLYPVRVSAASRDAVRKSMESQGVATQIHYPVPIHRQRAYAGFFAGTSFPAAEGAADELISLPMFPQLSDGDARRAAGALVNALRRLNEC